MICGFAPRKGDYLQQRGGHWRYGRMVPRRWRKIVGYREWVTSIGAMHRNDAAALPLSFAQQHDALIAHYERIGMQAAIAERMNILREMAAKAKEDGLLSHTDAEIVREREMRNLGCKSSNEEEARRSLGFMQAGIGARHQRRRT